MSCTFFVFSYSHYFLLLVEQLEKIFSKYGTVKDVSIISNRPTPFAFLTYATREEMLEALKDNTKLKIEGVTVDIKEVLFHLRTLVWKSYTVF